MLNWVLTNIKYTILCLNIIQKAVERGINDKKKKWIFSNMVAYLVGDV